MGTESVAITLNPQYPSPGERLTATIDDYSLGITFGTIEWLVDGVEIPLARNSRAVEIVAGALGTNTTLTVRLRLPTGATLESNVVITPQYTDIIIEPQTFTPQFYNGRAEPTVGSLVRATALIETARGTLNSASHTYLWKLNGTTLGGGSRTGAYQVAYEVPQGRDHVLSLEVYDQSGAIVTKRSVLVKTANVDIALYEVSPLYGLSTTAINNPLPFLGNTLTLRSVPYNLDLRSTRNNTFTEWQLDGRRFDAGIDPYEVTLGRAGNRQSTLSFKLRHREALLQGGEVRTTLQF
jgi:hypothetical protein